MGSSTVPLNGGLASRLGHFLIDLQRISDAHGIAICFMSGQDWLVDTETDKYPPVRINRTTDGYVAEESLW